MILRSTVTKVTGALLLAATTTGNWLAAAPAPPQALFLGSSTQLTTNVASQTHASISGEVVVWTDQRNGADDIYFCIVTDCAGTETQVTSASNAQRLNDVSGNLIAYTDVNGPTRVVHVFDIATSITTVLPGSADQNPRIGGQVVAFERGPASAVDVYAVDLTTGVEIPVAVTSALELNPVVSAGRVVYERHATGASPGDIVLHDIATGQTVEIEAGPEDSRRPDIDGNIVVWDALSESGDADIMVHNLTTSTTTRVSKPGHQRTVHVSGDVVSFDDDSAGNPNVGLYHIPSGAYELVATSPASEFLSDVSGNRVVFTANPSGNLDIHVFEFELQIPEIDVAPLSHDFGDVTVGSSQTTIVTISNVGPQPLSVTAVAFDAGSSPEFEIVSAPALPAVVPAEGTIDVGIRFAPGDVGPALAALEITSDDLDEALVQVALGGRGVGQAPTPSEQIADLLEFLDAAVASGTLAGDGPGNSAGGRLTALRNMIAGAGSLVTRGLFTQACAQLLEALRRADGEPQPPDFVTGTARTELAQRIQAIRIALGCS